MPYQIKDIMLQHMLKVIKIMGGELFCSVVNF